MGSIFFLLIAYQVKHFLADFPLQGKYMLKKFAAEPAVWIPALGSHALVHGVFTLAVVLLWGRPDLAWLAFLDFSVHFAVDRVKASPRMLGRFKPNQHQFWWALGADQMAHHLTHYFIIWRILA